MKGRISVLLVERDPQSAQLLLLLLAAPDARRCETARVERAEEALLHMERGEPVDAVLLGLPLGAGRPRERLRALRRGAPEAPVVAVVDPGAEALGRQAVAHGATSYWVRSADAGSLKRAVKAAVERGTAAERSPAPETADLPAAPALFPAAVAA